MVPIWTKFVFVFDRPAGDGPIEKFGLAGQMLLAGDAPAP
jgi:hypothetical protein